MQRGEIAPIPSVVACQQRNAIDSGLRVDEHVGQHTRATPAGPAILRKSLAGEEERRARRPPDLGRRIFEYRVGSFNPFVANRQLGVDHVVDAKRACERSYRQASRVLNERQSHDGVGRPPLAGVPAEMRETAWPLVPIDLDEDDSAISRPLKMLPGLMPRITGFGIGPALSS